ncbi:TIGR04086 family membrane protein [Alicyclobacillus macrosporangiidus]|uniref:Putative membrane protein, TIGR04086 family n=1 Tax=Alicyclobacillus macrosporangiidus TaxID=392015 RepID=A0A1I7J072_9BACL|nr:TIGR04086 family membrane protein [Alicyclobacillus macrosporangiidus]SFU78605.1 putative membrane protein, TIGR04086 family [Alicyclobacillus macrosporangiidus]
MDLTVRRSMRALRRFPVLYGLAWSLFVAAVGTLFLSLWAHFGTLSANRTVLMAYIVHCLSILCGALAASRAAGERGWYYGGLVGLSYAILMILIGVIVYNTFSLDPSGLFRVLVMALIGAFGGIIGINTTR